MKIQLIGEVGGSWKYKVFIMCAWEHPSWIRKCTVRREEMGLKSVFTFWSTEHRDFFQVCPPYPVHTWRPLSGSTLYDAYPSVYLYFHSMALRLQAEVNDLNAWQTCLAFHLYLHQECQEGGALQAYAAECSKQTFKSLAAPTPTAWQWNVTSGAVALVKGTAKGRPPTFSCFVTLWSNSLLVQQEQEGTQIT